MIEAFNIESKETFVAFLRGINVGGHHKVPMVDLRKEIEKLGLENVLTLLNSGNVIFSVPGSNPMELEKMISESLENKFGFLIPTIVRKAELIHELLSNNPFRQIEVTKDIRLYVSFLQQESNIELKLPWTSDDDSFKILEQRDKTIISVLDLSVSKTPKAMSALEKYYGTDITTRNWNTILRIGKKLPPVANY
ncbi:MAG: DUF1697 domain-containing protein [Balneola sp.]